MAGHCACLRCKDCMATARLRLLVCASCMAALYLCVQKYMGILLQSHALDKWANSCLHMIGMQGGTWSHALGHHNLYVLCCPQETAKQQRSAYADALSETSLSTEQTGQMDMLCTYQQLLGSDQLVMQCCAHLATSVCRPWMSCSCSACLACKSCMAASCCANLCQGAASSTAAGDLG